MINSHINQNLHWKLGQQSTICWNSLGLFRDYDLDHIFVGITLFCFSSWNFQHLFEKKNRKMSTHSAHSQTHLRNHTTSLGCIRWKMDERNNPFTSKISILLSSTYSQTHLRKIPQQTRDFTLLIATQNVFCFVL